MTMRTALVVVVLLTMVASPIVGMPTIDNNLQSIISAPTDATMNNEEKRKPQDADEAHITSDTPEEQSTHSSSSISSPEINSLHLRPRIISLNIMVAGLSGLGKTTMCSALLKSLVETLSQTENKKKSSATKTRSTVIIDESRQFEKYDREANTILRVRIIDTPGFGNRINHMNSLRPITKHIEQRRHYKYEKEMSSSSIQDYMNSTEDQLVHVCLYFLGPGRFLEIDRHFLKRIQRDIPTIIPIIAKADTLTDEEIISYRAEICQIFEKEGIQIYDFDDVDESLSSNIKESTSFDRGRRPGEVLAIISRDGIYPWGESYSLNREHSDLQLVRDLLLSQHTERFVDSALMKYTEYRSKRIARSKMINAFKFTALISAVALLVDGSYFCGNMSKNFVDVFKWINRQQKNSIPGDGGEILDEQLTTENEAIIDDVVVPVLSYQDKENPTFVDRTVGLLFGAPLPNVGNVLKNVLGIETGDNEYSQKEKSIPDDDREVLDE